MLGRTMLQNPHTHAPLPGVLEKLRKAAAIDFERAHPIPAEVNHSLAFHALEQAAIFQQEWICVGRADEIPAVGDFLTHEIAAVPVLVVRQADGEVRAFVNACAHRFACLVPATRGSAKRFTCRYHAWSYDCTGELLRAPHMQMQPDFDPAEHRLCALKVACWEGFVYVTLAQQPAKSLPEALAPLRENVVGRYDMACYQTLLRETMEWDANWKNLIENFIESYHVPVAHGKTFAQHLKQPGDYLCGEDSEHYCYHRAAQAADSGRGAAHPDNDRLAGDWRRMMIDFCVFPNHLVTLMPDYLWYISVQPLGTGRMRATWGLAVPPEVLADIAPASRAVWLAEFRQYLQVANHEDKALVEALHIGSRSPLLPQGAYHPIERNLWQFMRYLAQRCAVVEQQAG
jgi:phenylpropionate dioxygenase-like ring-hydroxylating dioxygenase large terminal subunit